MVIAIIGENCSGKSTLAERIKEEIGAEIISGKDYLRMAKSESEAVLLFKERECSNPSSFIQKTLEICASGALLPLGPNYLS